MNKKILLIALSVLTLLVACEDEERECSGVPVIGDVKFSIADEEAASEAQFGDWIIIEGANFCDVDSILFNDVCIIPNMNNMFIKSDLISVRIPGIMPNKLTGTITVATPYGKAVKEFYIKIPPLIVEGMHNEYAKKGQEGIINGNNFDVYRLDSLNNAWMEMGDSIVQLRASSAKQIKFRIPSIMKDNAKMTIFKTDTLGNLLYTVKVPGAYRNTKNIIFDLEDTTNWSTNEAERSNGLGLAGENYPDSISGKYAVFRGKYEPWNWLGKYIISWNTPLGEKSADFKELIGLPASEVLVVVDVNVVKEWNGSAFKFFLFDHEYIWMPWQTGGVSFMSYGWMTLRIPLSEFKNGAESFDTITEQMINGWSYRRIMFHGGENQSDLFIAWDNFRLVRAEQTELYPIN